MASCYSAQTTAFVLSPILVRLGSARKLVLIILPSGLILDDVVSRTTRAHPFDLEPFCRCDEIPLSGLVTTPRDCGFLRLSCPNFGTSGILRNASFGGVKEVLTIHLPNCERAREQLDHRADALARIPKYPQCAAVYSRCDCKFVPDC